MTATAATRSPSLPSNRWRTVDIVVTAVIGVAFGVVFFAWFVLWTALDPLFAAFKPLQYVISGVWLLPAVVAPLIVRRPGAAIFAEVVAALVSALMGSVWGLDAVLSGLIQGAGAELVFAFTLYRTWSLPVALLAGAGAAVGEAIHDIALYFRPDAFSLDFQLAIAAAMILSGVVIAGLGGWSLVRALRRTGVLESFPAEI